MISIRFKLVITGRIEANGTKMKVALWPLNWIVDSKISFISLNK